MACGIEFAHPMVDRRSAARPQGGADNLIIAFWRGLEFMVSQATSVGKDARPQTIPARKPGGLQVAQPVESCDPLERARVGVVEDDTQSRRALVFQLSTAGLCVTAYSSAENFLEEGGATEFDCILLDMYLPRINGLQLQEQISRAVPFASVIFITGHGDLSMAMCAMRNGAADFLEKPVDDDALLSSIMRGVGRSRLRRAAHLRRNELERRQSTLTPREREVFALVTGGLLNKQAGARLGTTERTIKAHRERVMHKMGAGSLADLVGMAATLQIQNNRGVLLAVEEQ
jgi:FixJ family two-component response regulator